jgi:hypothetical protein
MAPRKLERPDRLGEPFQLATISREDASCAPVAGSAIAVVVPPHGVAVEDLA